MLIVSQFTQCKGQVERERDRDSGNIVVNRLVSRFCLGFGGALAYVPANIESIPSREIIMHVMLNVQPEGSVNYNNRRELE